MAKNIVLEVGSSKTKILVCKTKNKKVELIDYRIIDTPTGVIGENDFIDTSLFVMTLKPLLKEMNIKRGNLSITLHYSSVINRVRELPRAFPKEMKELVIIEAEQFLPYDASEFVVDYRVLEEGERDQDVFFKTLVIAAPKHLVDAFIEIADKLRLNLVKIDAYINSMNNFAQKYLTHHDKNIIVADIGYRNMEMIVYEDHHYFASIKSRYGYENIVHNLSQLTGDQENELFMRFFNGRTVEVAHLQSENFQTQKNEISEDASTNVKLERLKERLNKIKEEQKKGPILKKAETSEVIGEEDYHYYLRSTFNEIETELSRMIDYFQSRKYGTKVDKIFLVGGASNIRGLANHLREGLGIEVDYISAFEGAENTDPNDFNLLIPSLGCIIGGEKQ